jgi:hypothetical protein
MRREERGREDKRQEERGWKNMIREGGGGVGYKTGSELVGNMQGGKRGVGGYKEKRERMGERLGKR